MTAVYLWMADLVLILHVAFVLFVVLGLALIVAGGVAGWSWTRDNAFRLLHLVGITVVAAQAWFGTICPLTTLEMWLRRQGNDAAYEGSFIQYWLQTLLYYDAPQWIFVLVYTGFGILVVLACIVFPPNFIRAKTHD